MAEKLVSYNKKRNFNKTGEPRGKTAKTKDNLRYVIQHHIASRDHYDFRLEWDGTLLSWAVPKGPSFNTKDKRLAVQVEDHPIDYRNFESTIPKGQYGGGTVMIWDEGIWNPIIDVDSGLEDGSLKFELRGERLHGKWALIRMKPKPNEKNDNWLLIKEKDEYVKSSAGISQYKTSVRSGRTMAKIEKEQTADSVDIPFDKADIQLAKLVTKVPEESGWLYEVKYDGYRIMAYIQESNVYLSSRNGKDYTEKFAEVENALSQWAQGRSMVLDGEMIVPDANGKSDFQALQQYIKHPQEGSLRYMAFDILALDGEDLRELTLKKRKSILKKLLKDAPEALMYSVHVEEKGEESLEAAAKSNLEGIIGKRSDSVYSGTRNGDWIKIKCETRQEFVIGGYTLSSKRQSGISSLLLGVYEGEKLIYCGRASGMSEKTMEELEGKFSKIQRKTSAFSQAPTVRSGEEITWLRPFYAAEIRFAEWTKEGLLRQASFKGLRTDKDIKEIKKESPIVIEKKQPKAKTKESDSIIEGVELSNPQKLLFENPPVTKVELAQYYQKVSPRMMPYLEKRILSTIRCPGGRSKSCFFKKHPNDNSKGIVIVQVSGDSGEDDYFYAKDVTGVIAEVQMNTLEFHIWGSRADNQDKPDMLVFDLDPDEGMDIEQVRQGVRHLKSVLDELALVSFLKTSGGKGYHIVVPITPSANWDEAKDFSKNIAKIMEQKWPELYTTNVRKEKRKNKIFIDWIRNGKGSTSVAPYSVRARDGAPVSMPIAWRELGKTAPNEIDMKQAVKRLSRKDPWEDFFKVRQKIK